jgi:hypothetical protein
MRISEAPMKQTAGGGGLAVVVVEAAWSLTATSSVTHRMTVER